MAKKLNKKQFGEGSQLGTRNLKMLSISSGWEVNLGLESPKDTETSGQVGVEIKLIQNINLRLKKINITPGLIHYSLSLHQSK